MAIEFLPIIMVDPITGKTFRQSRTADTFGMRKYRRARRVMPGVWYTYRNTFSDYPGGYRPFAKERSQMTV